MSKIEELYNIAQSLKCENREEVIDALCFLNQPIADYVTEDYLNVKDLKRYMQFDVFYDTYKRKSLKDYEEQRLEALKQIDTTDNIAEDFSIAIRETAKIREGIHGINYNEMYKSCYKIVVIIEVCKNMMLQGASLTEISKYVPGSQMGDIYHLATDHLGMNLELSKEEKTEVKRYDEMMEKGNQNSVSLRDIMRWAFIDEIPHKQSDESGWSIDGKQIYDPCTMACIFAECQMSFPYYYEDNVNPTYAKNFDELLEKIMLQADRVSFGGLEMAYSSQEWNLINRLQEKLLIKWKEKNFEK